MPGRAVNITDSAALAAHDMVVVIAYPRLIASNMAVRLNATNEPCRGQCFENVIDGLMRNLRELKARGLDDRVGIGVGVRIDRSEHGQAGLGDAQVGIAELLSEIDGHNLDRRPVS